MQLKNINNQAFSLALFDLDNLKEVNDNLGHAKGDYILKLIAELAKESLNAPDFVSRVGGDEFAVILYKPLDEAIQIMEAFQSKVCTNADLQQVKSTVSIGITEVNQSDNGTTVYKRTDEAMYKSKKCW